MTCLEVLVTHKVCGATFNTRKAQNTCPRCLMPICLTKTEFENNHLYVRPAKGLL